MPSRSKTNLTSFNFFHHMKDRFSAGEKSSFILLDHNSYREQSVLTPFRNFFYSIGILYGAGTSFEIGCTQHKIQPGTLITIGPGVISQWSNDFQVESDTLLFVDDHLKAIVKSSFLSSLSFFSPGGNHVITISSEAIRHIRSLFELMKAFRANEEIVAGLTYSLLQFIILQQTKIVQDKPSSFTHDVVSNFRASVAKHFLNHRSVTFYASQLNVTSKYLSQICLAHTAKSAKAMIAHVVFLEAKTLLIQTTMTIQQISRHLGYSDTSYFTKAFKQREAVSPLQYRKLHRK
jgi:AraC family transcriptional regulator, transcriptional activator of pobA